MITGKQYAEHPVFEKLEKYSAFSYQFPARR